MTVLDERFTRWFESVELEPASKRFGALREASEAVGARLQLGAALDLVAYAAGRSSASAFDAVRAAVSETDRTFSAAAGDLEPRLVAAAAVARVLESDDDTAAVVAGAVLSAEFAGLQFAVEELPQLARAALASRFRRLRERAEIPRVQFESLFDDVPDGRFIQPGEQAGQLVTATRTLAAELTTTLALLGQRFEMRLDAADEELNILWWAFAARNTDNDRGWGDRSSSPETLLRIGRELADRHRFNAEIPSAREILGSVLGPLASEVYALADVVTVAAEQVNFDEVRPGPLLPILTSCAEYLAFKDAEFVAFRDEYSWMNSAGRYGVDPTITRRGDEIAAQTLRELLLARALG